MNDERLQGQLAARLFLYTVFQSLMGSAPTARMLDGIDAELVAASFEELGLEAPEGFVSLLSSRIDIEKLSGEYTRCFEGPARLPSPVWETVHVTGEASIFQTLTLEVRNAYRSQGFLPKLYPSVADDHIALELDFLRALAGRACSAAESGDMAACKSSLQASRQFLDDHLSRWAGSYARQLVDSKASDFYGSAATALAELVERDVGLLAELCEKR